MFFKSLWALTIAGTIHSVWAVDINKLAESCTLCHGKDGASVETNIPTIGGLSAKYLNFTFKAYKEKSRVCAETEYKSGELKGTKTDMCKIVEGLSDDDAKNLAKFYAGKKFVRAIQKFDAELAAKGKAIHKQNCEKCHSEEGSKAMDDASILAGQQMGYLDLTFKEIAAEKRAMDKKMKAKVEALDQESFNALLNYYGSFK